MIVLYAGCLTTPHVFLTVQNHADEWKLEGSQPLPAWFSSLMHRNITGTKYAADMFLVTVKPLRD